MDTEPQDLDLKTLRLLRHLLETASVTRTAERMGLSQPAASRAVARLRALLADPLLVRTRRGYVLTPRALELRPAVEAALSATQALFTGQRFDPASSARRFSVGSTDYGSATVMSYASCRLAREAPHVQLDIVPFDADMLRRLEAGTADLALWADEPLPPDFHYRRLFVDHYACVVRGGHPLAREKSRSLLRQLRHFPQVMILYPGDQGFAEDDVLARLELGSARVAMRTPYFSAAPWFLRDTDWVMCLPARMAALLTAGTGLEAVPLAAPELDFEYRLVWHERAHRDAGNRWLRELLRQTASVGPV